MKKGILVLSLVLVIGIFSAFAYAETPVVNEGFRMGRFGNVDGIPKDVNSEEFLKLREERLQFKKDNLKKMLEEKVITEEEVKIWEGHFEYMDEFHKENGYLGGHCGGRMDGETRRGMGRHHMGW